MKIFRRMPLHRTSSAALLLTLAATPVWAEQATNPLPGGKKGILTVEVTTTGAVHTDNTKQERQDWSILRKAEFRIPLVSMMSSNVDLMADQKAEAPPVPHVTGSQAQVLERLQKAMRNCNPDDQKCLVAAAQRIAASSDAPDATVLHDMPAPGMDFTHYQMWRADPQGQIQCGAGSASVHETMDGRGLSDNSGAMWSIEGIRNGDVKLPNPSWSHSCDSAISFDRKAGTYSLRIGGLHLGVPSDLVVQRKGMSASAAKGKMSFDLLEYTKIPLKDYGLTVKNQKGTQDTVAGSVTFSSVAPSQRLTGSMTEHTVPNVKTTIAWHLTLE